MATADAPDFQYTLTTTISMTGDAPDFQQTAVGPGGAPIGGGGYASLTGPGQTSATGSLTQTGDFLVNSPAGGFGFNVQVYGGVYMTVFPGNASAVFDLFNQAGALRPLRLVDESGLGIKVIADAGGDVELNVSGGSNVMLTGLNYAADNAAALAAGLVAGELYTDASDPRHVCIVF